MLLATRFAKFLGFFLDQMNYIMILAAMGENSHPSNPGTRKTLQPHKQTMGGEALQSQIVQQLPLLLTQQIPHDLDPRFDSFNSKNCNLIEAKHIKGRQQTHQHHRHLSSTQLTTCTNLASSQKACQKNSS